MSEPTGNDLPLASPPTTAGLGGYIDRILPGPGGRVDRVSQHLQDTAKAAYDTPAGRVITPLLRGDTWLGHPSAPGGGDRADRRLGAEQLVRLKSARTGDPPPPPRSASASASPARCGPG